MPKRTGQFVNESNMLRAIRDEGLQDFPHRVETSRALVKGVSRKVYIPVFLCELDEDLADLSERGFRAVKVNKT